MTRISSPYKVVKNAVLALFTGMGWIRSAYLFHEQRHDAANPRCTKTIPSSAKSIPLHSIPYGECYLLMASVQPHLYRKNKMEHNYFMFNELNYNHLKMLENLRRASTLSNGQSVCCLFLPQIAWPNCKVARVKWNLDSSEEKQALKSTMAQANETYTSCNILHCIDNFHNFLWGEIHILNYWKFFIWSFFCCCCRLHFSCFFFKHSQDIK